MSHWQNLDLQILSGSSSRAIKKEEESKKRVRREREEARKRGQEGEGKKGEGHEFTRAASIRTWQRFSA
jgi:hypothetical protein